jgi:hypothetical protein
MSNYTWFKRLSTLLTLLNLVNTQGELAAVYIAGCGTLVTTKARLNTIGDYLQRDNVLNSTLWPEPVEDRPHPCEKKVGALLRHQRQD